MLSKIILTSILSFASVAYAAEVEEVFNAHKDEILNATWLGFNQYLYGVGRISINSSSKSAKQTAFERAELQSNVAILEGCQLANIAWPESFTKKDIHIACDILYKDYPFNIKSMLRHAVRVFAQAQDGQCIVVSGAEEKNIQKFPCLTFEQVYPFLLSRKIVIFSDVPIDTLRKFYSVKQNLPCDVDLDSWKGQIAKARFSQPSLRRLTVFCGRYPIGKDAGFDNSYKVGMNYYEQNDWPHAYDAFVESVAANYNFDALNMAGNVARRLGKLNEAVVLLLHAHYLNPSSPYPMVHLAWVAKELQSTTVLDKILKMLRSYKLDAWSASQIKQLQIDS